MKMKLFHVSITMATDRHTVQIVAPDEKMAAEFLRNHLRKVGDNFIDYTMLRIDETLSGEARLGLEPLLEDAPVSFTSYADGLGWVAHVAPIRRLQLFSIETPTGHAAHVIAPNEHIAAAAWWEKRNAPDDEPVLYRIVNGMAGLDDLQRESIRPLLEFGSVGVARWTAEGWKVRT